jgi:PKD repeat protein
MIFLGLSVPSQAQADQNIINEGPQNPTLIVEGILVAEVPSIAEQIANGTFKPAENIVKEFNPKRWGANTSVPGKGFPIDGDPLLDQQSRAPQVSGRAPLLTFEAASATATPTDPTGAVGPNHYVNSWNSAFRIWDKAGNPLTAAASLSTIFPGTLGDPIVMYDRYADRFFISEFYSNGFDVAVSKGPNPVTSGWWVYRFATSSFPDYPKFSVWSDGYYVTANKDQGSPGTSQVVFVMNRTNMLSGLPATMIGFPLPGIINSGFYSPLAFNANGPTPPPAGNVPVVYMQDDSWAGVASDHLKLWNINVNWATPASSTISAAQIIPTQPFDGLFDGGSFSNLPQPPGGADIDALQATIMYMAQYRRFPTYNTAVFNFVVDLNGADNYSGIRWFELRQTTDGAPWSIYQEGTYSHPGGPSAFSGTMCMDANGSIGMSYTIVSTSQFPSLRFTGRRATDPLGTMTITPESFANGTQIDPSSRYGDYAQMTIDPTDDSKFWTIGEYFNGGRKNQVGVFQIVPLSPVAQFIASTTTPMVGQTVTFTDQSVNSPTSWTWSFSPSTVTFVGGTSASSQNPQVQFNAMGNYTVTLNASNTYGSDAEIKTNYISVGYCTPSHSSGTASGDYISLVQLGSINNSTGASGSPYYTYYNTLSTDLPRSSTHTITLSPGSYGGTNSLAVFIDFNKNGLFESSEKLGNVTSFGAFSTATITFTVPYNAQLGTTRMRVRETFANNNIDPCANYTYGETEDYNVNILPVQYCTPTSLNGTGYGDYISLVQLGTINNSSAGAPSPYYTYYSSLSTDLTASSDYAITLSAGTFGSGNYIAAWIDYNFDGIFDESEKLGTVLLGAAPATSTLYFSVPGNCLTGSTRLRVREVYNLSNVEPCGSSVFGETEDYNINLLPKQYCTPTYIAGSGEGDYISLVQLGTINNPTGASPSPYYTYYSTQSTNLTAGSTYTLTLSPGTYTSGNHICAWIDYDSDGSFEEIEKLGFIDLAPMPATGNITFTVPENAIPGITRMRVREVYQGGLVMDPCLQGYYGETEDYNIQIINPNKVLMLTALLQGLYSGGGNLNKASDGTGPVFTGDIADVITIYFSSASDYYEVEYLAIGVNLNTRGEAILTIPAALNGSYYVTVYHRNSIQTVSNLPISFASNFVVLNFNNPFKAYGGNLGMTTDGRYAIYGGNVEFDGIVDGSDMAAVDNASTIVLTGYVVQDANGDGLVDGSDMAIIDNNATLAISAILP